MKFLILSTVLFLASGNYDLFGQCGVMAPPSVKKVQYAAREVAFSDVTMNGKSTTYLAVEKGAPVQIKTKLRSQQNGDYCPSCIVQVYWGIRGHASVCAKSFYGYQFNSKKSTLKFNAPMKDGIYYITMGGTLDYSCKNNVLRPSCSPDDAFAVLKVGNPDPEQKINLVKVNKGANEFLKTDLIKSGCFGDLDKVEWFLDEEKLAFNNKVEIPLTQFGNYSVTWSNCIGSISESFAYNSKDAEVKEYQVTLDANPKREANEQEVKSFTRVEESNPQDNPSNSQVPSFTRVKKPNTNNDVKEDESYSGDQGSGTDGAEDIAVLIENNDSFVLKNLIFDLSKADIKPEAKRDLDKLAEIMKEKPSMKILLEGHTDFRGSARKNQVLSEKRVKSTKEYLIEQGVHKSNISTKGWGHQKPLVVTTDVEEGKINRRVEISILSR